MPVKKSSKKKKEHNIYCRTCKKLLGVNQRKVYVDKCVECIDGNLETPPRKKRSSSTKVHTAQEAFSRAKKGPALDLPEKYREIHFRSGWERNFARVLCAENKEWTYERTTFQFHDVSRKPFGYLPDFHDTKNDILYEVKGYLRSEDRSKIRRFKSQFPSEFTKLQVICSKSNKVAVEFYTKMGILITFYEELHSKWKGTIQNWEG